MNVYEAIDTSKNRKFGFKEIKDNQRTVAEGFVSGQDFLMVAPTGPGKSPIFHIAPFKNITLHKWQKCLAMTDMIMFGWTFQLISPSEKVEQ